MSIKIIVFLFLLLIIKFAYGFCPIDIINESECKNPSQYIYEIVSIPNRFQDISTTGNLLNVSENGVSNLPCSLNFTFNFYGSNYSKVYPSSTGALIFTPGVQTDTIKGQISLPHYGEDSLRAFVGALWMPLVAQANSTIHYQTFGGAQSKYFIVQYSNFSTDNSHSSIATFQLKLFETVNIIQLHILNATIPKNIKYTLAAVQDFLMFSSKTYYFGQSSSNSGINLDGLAFEIRNECYSSPDGTLCGNKTLNNCTTEARCHEGQCVIISTMVDGTVCDDLDACTNNSVCKMGICMPTSRPLINNPTTTCEKETCNPFTGINSDIRSINGDNCTISNKCFGSSYCSWGQCTGSDLVVCELNDSCHEEGICNPSTGTCSYTIKQDNTPCEIEDSMCLSGTTCQSGICVADVIFPNGTDCDDLNKCTFSDECYGGQCSGIQVSCPDVMCHTSTCDESTGECVHILLIDGSLCNDGDQCTVDDRCIKGQCQGEPLCNTTNPCELYSCDSGECNIIGVSNSTCDDGNYCTFDDHCSDGECVGTQIESCGVDQEVNKNSDTVELYKLIIIIVSAVAFVLLATLLGFALRICWKRRVSYRFATEEMAIRF